MQALRGLSTLRPKCFLGSSISTVLSFSPWRNVLGLENRGSRSGERPAVCSDSHFGHLLEFQARAISLVCFASSSTIRRTLLSVSRSSQQVSPPIAITPSDVIHQIPPP